MCQSNLCWNAAFVSPLFSPMPMQPMMAMAPQSAMFQQQPGVAPGIQPRAAMQGTPFSGETMQEQSKIFLNAQKGQLLQTKKFLEEQLKFIDKSVSSIDEQLANLGKQEPDPKKGGK